ncbi:MAG TPA: ABC transporter substrate-binding protein [Burkholderiales bacterium]|nr:ABC transporter substrate-binding protein [Burkholderiales bacterium]
MRALALLLSVAALTLAANVHAAERTEVRIVQQFGLSYLPLHVAVDRKLIEKHAKAAGLGDIKITLSKLGSGAAVNDALISGSVDVALGGTTVLMNLWDKSKGGRGDIKGIMAFCDTPMVIVTIDPRIKSIRDYREGDRIAMTAARGTHHSISLQMAAAKEFGMENRTKLDNLTVGMSHPDAMIAMLSGKHEVKSHSATVPFLQQELADPRVHRVLSSYDVAGGRHTLIVAYGATRWKNENPRTYAAVVAGLEEAMAFINANKRAAADIYLKAEKTKLSADEIHKMLLDENTIYFSPTPSKVMVWADYMVKVGLLQNKPSSWKDFFFENVHDKPGS